MKRFDTMKIRNENIQKIVYHDDVFSVIEGYVYYQLNRCLHVICVENQRVGDKIYTTTEYIKADPNKAIQALKY